MAVLSFTFLDLRQAVWTLLYGQKFAETEAGSAAVDDACNRAQAEVPAILGSLMFAGGLYNPVSISSAGTGSFDLSSSGLMVPVYAEVLEVVTPASYGRSSYAVPERLLDMPRSGLPGVSQYLFSFLGRSLLVRPDVPAGGGVIVHGIKMPTVLAADGDVLEADPRLFRAISLRAAWIVLQKFPGVDPNRLQQIAGDMTSELSALQTLIDNAKVGEFQMRTGRDVQYGGRAPGQGG